jgi:putative membrane protein
MMNALTDPTFVAHLVAALVFALVGLIFFTVAFVIMVKAAPFSVRKEIEEDQNTALAIIMGSVILGIALIVGMAIQG